MYNGATLFHALTCINGDKLGSVMELVSTFKGDHVGCIMIIPYILNILLIIMEDNKLCLFVCMLFKIAHVCQKLICNF